MTASFSPGVSHALRRVAAALAGGVLLAACGSDPELPPLAATDRVLAFGDSLTFGTGAPPGQSYPAVLAALIGRDVVNAGVPGEVTAQGLTRLAGVLEKVSPRLVVLCHGGNDILRRRPPSALQRNIEAMVALVRSHRAQVVLMGIPGRNLTLRASPVYENVANALQVPIDAESVPSLMRTASYKSDPIHFNAAGYQAMARAVAALIRNAGGLDAG